MPPKLFVSAPWGRASDSVLSSAPLLTSAQSVSAMQLNDISDTSFTNKQKDDKLPHDASVFVGSLPSNIDQGDLTRMLMEHLSEHIQIKNIKVVRDSKGGVCAFVQCENATSATALIQTLHSSVPKPFLGRILRYEPARAFRSLLISYRAPTQFVRSSGINFNTPTSISGEIELDLPDAMRIWKQRNSRFHSILYNSEAVQAEEICDRGVPNVPVLNNTLFLHPLKFDAETLHKLASYFGSLEKFTPLKVPNAEDESHDNQRPTNSYPEPHCAPRSPSMDDSCWEIKWEHRDDCVSALMTLRRVPHLSVTWAHQPASLGQINHSTNQQCLGSPSFSLHAHHSPFASHPFMPQNLRISPSFQHNFQQLGEKDENVDASNKLVGDDGKTAFPNPSFERDGDGPQSSHQYWAEDSGCSTRKDIETSRILEEENRAIVLSQQPWAARGCPSKSLAANQNPQTILNNRQEGSAEEPAGGKSTNSNSSPEFGVQELYMPQTPALDSSTITPLTPGSHFPITPPSSAADIPQNMSRKESDGKVIPMPFKGPRPDREIDPTTLFVGGLEMFGPGAWDEEKVRGFFSRFGGLESVKVVRPLNSCAAFAFVKFDNAEAPARAVFEEHNRVYEGRAMRVQLRDCNPPRNNWKYARGRGRGHLHHFVVPRRLNYRPSFGAKDRIPFHVNNEDKANFQDTDVAPEIRLSALADALPARDRESREGIPSSSSSLDNSSASAKTPPTEKYREWYDEPESSACTPEPSSLGSSVSTAGVSFSASPYAYPMPNGPYISPPPWMHPYSPHGPYQMSYYPGYPVYPSTASQQPHQALITPPGSDVGGPTTPAQHNWPHMGMYASYIPYPALASRTQIVEQGQPPQPHLSAQAPVVPTGFIQNEQGTLIAVYQPEVLNQYLAGSGPAPTSMAHYSSSSQLYEAGNMTPNTFPHATPTQNRTKTAGLPSLVPQQFLAPQREADSTFNAMPSPLYHRQGAGRREIQHGYGSVRQHNHPPSFNSGRPNRTQMHHPAHIHTDPGYCAAQPAMPGAADWNRWNPNNAR